MSWCLAVLCCGIPYLRYAAAKAASSEWPEASSWYSMIMRQHTLSFLKVPLCGGIGRLACLVCGDSHKLIVCIVCFSSHLRPQQFPRYHTPFRKLCNANWNNLCWQCRPDSNHNNWTLCVSYISSFLRLLEARCEAVSLIGQIENFGGEGLGVFEFAAWFFCI